MSSLWRHVSRLCSAANLIPGTNRSSDLRSSYISPSLATPKRASCSLSTPSHFAIFCTTNVVIEATLSNPPNKGMIVQTWQSTTTPSTTNSNPRHQARGIVRQDDQWFLLNFFLPLFPTSSFSTLFPCPVTLLPRKWICIAYSSLCNRV